MLKTILGVDTSMLQSMRTQQKLEWFTQKWNINFKVFISQMKKFTHMGLEIRSQEVYKFVYALKENFAFFKFPCKQRCVRNVLVHEKKIIILKDQRQLTSITQMFLCIRNHLQWLVDEAWQHPSQSRMLCHYPSISSNIIKTSL